MIVLKTKMSIIDIKTFKFIFHTKNDQQWKNHIEVKIYVFVQASFH